jgi:hypothetical protein
METPRGHQFERDEIEAAVIRERELNEAVCYLDRAISRFATQDSPSRWLNSHRQLPARSLPTPGPASLIQLCVAALRNEWRSLSDTRR